jgi:prepilin-type processing-associated H-X9-DG protein
VACYRAVDCLGIFWRNSYYKGGVKIREITDGTSHTLLIGETSPEDGNSPAWSSDGDWAVAAIQLNWDWRASGHCLDSSGNSTGNRPECYTQIRGFRSYHPGAVGFAFCDGSVQFLSENIEHITFRAVSTKNIGETIGSLQ